MFSKHVVGPKKSVDSYQVLTCILEVVPSAPIRASLESYVREATFLWVKIIRQADSVYVVCDGILSVLSFYTGIPMETELF